MKALILATNGAIFVDNGNIYILNRLKNYIKSYDVKVYIVFPITQTLQELQKSYPSSLGINIYWISSNEHTKDPYYIQLGIAKLFETLSENDQCIYLDYDHIIIDDSFAYKLFNQNKTMVSSEITTYSNKFLPELTKHYNTSLIYGFGNCLHKIGSQWYDVYNSIEKCTDYRNRTEIAFTLLTKMNKIKITTCSPYLQSCFNCRAKEFLIFHYGGISPTSLFMKKQLGSICFSHLSSERLDELTCELTMKFTEMLGFN